MSEGLIAGCGELRGLPAPGVRERLGEVVQVFLIQARHGGWRGGAQLPLECLQSRSGHGFVLLTTRTNRVLPAGKLPARADHLQVGSRLTRAEAFGARRPIASIRVRVAG
jgi:hypothetical protein